METPYQMQERLVEEGRCQYVEDGGIQYVNCLGEDGETIRIQAWSPQSVLSRVWSRWRSEMRSRVGWFLNWLGVPGAIVPMAFHDLVLDEDVSVRVTPLFTIFSVGSRDFYFYRISGGFDGTGSRMGCAVKAEAGD